jgi:hypothetical protein
LNEKYSNGQNCLIVTIVENNTKIVTQITLISMKYSALRSLRQVVAKSVTKAGLAVYRK